MAVPTEAELALRDLVAQGIQAVTRMGVTQKAISTVAGVTESEVSRWKLHRRHTPIPSSVWAMADKWPEAFNHQELRLLYARLRDPGADAHHIVSRIVEGTEAVYEEVVAAIDDDPKDQSSRRIRQVSFHRDHRDGSDPAQTDPQRTKRIEAVTQAFAAALRRRAIEGWRIEQVISASTIPRVDELERRIRTIEGPEVWVKGFAGPVPLVLNVLIIGRRDVFIAYDHLRWERPGSMLVLHHPSVVEWAEEYFAQLFRTATCELLTPAGIRPQGFEEMRERIRRPA